MFTNGGGKNKNIGTMDFLLHRESISDKECDFLYQ
jgi:hypothetical protein